MSAKMKTAILSLAMLPFAAAAARLEPPQLPPSPFADTEASTNIAFSTGGANDRRWTFSLEIDADDAVNAQIEFGIDRNGDGALALDEGEAAVGWDCGEWFWRDKRGGESRRSAESPGRRRLEFAIYLDEQRQVRSLRGNVFDGGAQPTYFNPNWNMARVVVRGTNAVNEVVRSSIAANAFSVSVQ